MNLLKNKSLLRNLLKQGDYWNAMNGGVSMTSYKTYKTNEGYIIEISAPTVSPESFNIILNFNHLIVYTLFKGESHGENNMIPMFSKSFELPGDTDSNNIDAIFENSKLKIVVPFKTDLDQYKRRIDIKAR